MNVKNCIKCGRIFNYVAGKRLCQSCRKDLEDQFKDVRTFIRDNKEASIAEVAESCQVDVKDIKQWIREERLTFSKNSSIGIDCEVCGKTIKTGRFCDECKKTVTDNLKSAYKEQPKKVMVNPFAKKTVDSKMRFMNKDK